MTSIARQLVFKHLCKLQQGMVVLCENNRQWKFGKITPQCPLEARLIINHSSFYRAVILGGNVGAGDAYIKNLWSSDSLVDLIRIFIVNRPVALDLEKGFAKLSKPLKAVFHLLRRNTKKGSRRNILAHYDIGNDFFRLFLDESLMYSSAIYPREESTLEEAATYKIDLICKKLDLSNSDHLLEIGSGWGALAIHAAKHYGCQVTTTTISDEQYSAVTERIKQAGLEQQINVLKKDYRDLTGEYDKLVSVEMFEAVGHKYFNVFFKTCDRLLKPDGLMLLQTINIADEYYERAKRSIDFIQRYIFPGGCLPSIKVLSNCIRKSTNMRLIANEAYAMHYARTLSEWRDRFIKQLEQVRMQGYPESFIRMWEYYLCYCQAGFTENSIDVNQLLLAKSLP